MAMKKTKARKPRKKARKMPARKAAKRSYKKRIVRNPGKPPRRRRVARVKQSSTLFNVLLGVGSIITGILLSFVGNRIPNKRLGVAANFVIGVPALAYGVKKKNIFAIGAGATITAFGLKSLITQVAPQLAGEPSPDDIQALTDYQNAEMLGENYEIDPAKYLSAERAGEVAGEVYGETWESMQGEVYGEPEPSEMDFAFSMNGDSWTDDEMYD